MHVRRLGAASPQPQAAFNTSAHYSNRLANSNDSIPVKRLLPESRLVASDQQMKSVATAASLRSHPVGAADLPVYSMAAVWPSTPAHALARTKSFPPLGPGVWARCIARAIRGWIAKSH
jgi:hypothetical protein